MDLNKILVIIPVRNEESTITEVIKTLQRVGLSQIRVIDNGSSDRTQDYALKAGAKVLTELVAGYGQACWRGLQEIPNDIEWILFCDGDGSDDLQQLTEFWFYGQDYDFILGNRLCDKENALTPVQRFGNQLAGILMNLGWGYKYHDLGPLRLIRRQALEGMKMEDRGFGWTVEMQVKALEANLTIIELPVRYYPRKGGKSKISGTIYGSFQAGRIILSTLGRLYLRRHSRILAIISAFLLIFGTILLQPHGNFSKVEAVPNLWRAIAIMGVGFILSGGITKISAWLFWGVVIFCRLWLLGMYPDSDLWRYLWEGYIQNLGFNPYQFAPDASILIPYRFEWWSNINHPNHAAIYPPITQLIFRRLAGLNPNIIIFKSAFTTADLGICYLLYRRFGYEKTLLYAWNPLILNSYAGGGHYDSLFILFLVWGWFVYQSQSILSKVKSAFLIGMSIAIKWISISVLIYLGWQEIKKLKLKSAILILAVGMLPFILTALPYCSKDFCSIIPINTTFVQYGRSAELIPYFLGAILPNLSQTNLIYGVILFIIFLILLFTIKDLYHFILAYLLSFLLVSPVIHAWYFTWLIPFGVRQQDLGIKLMSLSAFIYFILPYRMALGDFSWHLTLIERGLLWFPLGITLYHLTQKKRT